MSADVATGVHIPKDPAKFEFDEEVAKVFDNMAQRSIAGYDVAYEAIERMVSRLDIPEYAQVLDLGTTTGRGLVAVQRGAKTPYVDYVGVDVSQPMLERTQAKMGWARTMMHDLTTGLPAGVKQGKVAVIVLGWTLQFMQDKEARRRLLTQCHEALMPGGLLFVMEKFSLASFPELDLIQQHAYISWRRNNGYSIREIEAKSAALVNAMWPWTPGELLDATGRAGFEAGNIGWLYRLHNFGGIVAKKAG